jgi:hypothetical protein
MKPKNLNHFKLLAFACFFQFFFQSCVLVPGTWKNEKISAGKRDDFHQLNTEALNYLKANDPKGLKAVLSKEMIDGKNEREVELISNRLNDNLYELLDEYYVVNKYKDTDSVHSVGGSVNRYSLVYPFKTTEMYFAFFVPKKPANKYMISLIYGKYDYGWKIVKLDVQPYTINGKTAPELYALAREQFDKKYYQAAMDNVSLAVTCFKPCQYFKYADEVEAGDLYTRAHQQVSQQYAYPLVLRQVSSGPMILRIYNKSDDDGTYPDVYYMTHYNLKDTNAVKKENLQIRNTISKIMPGLKENNKFVLYSAFNSKPTGYNTVDHFDMKEKVK